MNEIIIQDDMIRLGQFLKLADLVESGAQAREAIADGEVSVNGELELRRGRQLFQGDIITLTTPRGISTAKVG